MSASGQSAPIVNELLAFLQQKLLLEGVMDTVSAVQICSSSFSVEDICAAKKVLHESLGIAGTYVPHRRGDETGKKTLENIINVLRENEDRIPEFTTTGASSLPSYIPDHVDVSCLLKEIVALKTSLADVISKFDAAQVTITELRNEVISLRNSALTRSAASNFKCDDRQATSAESVSLRVADTVKCVASAVLPPAILPRARPPPASSKSRHRVYADVVAGPKVAPNRVSVPVKGTEDRAAPKEKLPVTSVDEEDFTVVSRKKKARTAPRKTQCGTAEPANSGLRIATPSKALYVSRLHYTATAAEVVEYSYLFANNQLPQLTQLSPVPVCLMDLLKAVVLISFLRECQPFKRYPQISEFVKNDAFLEPPLDPKLKGWVPLVKSDDHTYDDYYNNDYNKHSKPPPPQELEGGDNIRDLYSTLNELDKWVEFRRESSVLRQKYADSPKDEYHKELLKNDLNEWARQLKNQHAREVWEQEQRSMPRKPALPSIGFSPYWNPEVLRVNLQMQEDIDSQFTTTKRPRFDLQQQRMISGPQMMEMAIQKMENAAMAKAVRNVTLPPTETKNTHRRSIYGRRQNVAQEPPARARIPWSPPKSQPVLGPRPGMASYYSKHSLVAANIPPTPEELENGVLGPSPPSPENADVGEPPRPPETPDGPQGPGPYGPPEAPGQRARAGSPYGPYGPPGPSIAGRQEARAGSPYGPSGPYYGPPEPAVPPEEHGPYGGLGLGGDPPGGPAFLPEEQGPYGPFGAPGRQLAGDMYGGAMRSGQHPPVARNGLPRQYNFGGPMDLGQYGPELGQNGPGQFGSHDYGPPGQYGSGSPPGAQYEPSGLASGAHFGLRGSKGPPGGQYGPPRHSQYQPPSKLRYIGSAGPPPDKWNWDVSRQQPNGGPESARDLLREQKPRGPFHDLPQVDDFGEPIQWVALTAANTEDGLARVTDRKTGRNVQTRINGTVYVPVSYRPTTTTEPTTTTTEITTTPDPVMESLLQFVTPRNLKPEDWLAFDVSLNKKKAPQTCDSDGCQARCHKNDCETACRGDTCASGCIGSSCKAMCEGPGCLTMCIGDNCNTQCKGHSCDARCIGKECKAYCGSVSCRYTINGEVKSGMVQQVRNQQHQPRPIARTSVEDDELGLESSERIAQGLNK
ncbi:uncharacterized protein LOC134801712 [Cydia splendana]|uniref:uncharacterized protein LOC134801712 n=1 Tax=Cydia splendana TaxID=1100963 RepID=UPI00300CA79D